MKFGYQMIKGKYVIISSQLSVILKTYADYIMGTSLKTKADELTALKVEYALGKSTWNKNRVQRMLTDTNYLGNDTYPQIIDKETFDKVQKIMQSRNTQKNCNRQEVFSSSIVPIKCGICGSFTTRRHIPNSVEPKVVHTCCNPDCKHIYHTTDESLRNMVKAKMMQAIEIEMQPLEEIILDIHRLNNEIERDLKSTNIDPENLKNKIFQSAALEYCLCTEKKKSIDYSQVDPCSQIFIREIKSKVSAVYLKSDGDICLQMTDGQTIGKENDVYVNGCN